MKFNIKKKVATSSQFKAENDESRNGWSKAEGDYTAGDNKTVDSTTGYKVLSMPSNTYIHLKELQVMQVSGGGITVYLYDGDPDGSGTLLWTSPATTSGTDITYNMDLLFTTDIYFLTDTTVSDDFSYSMSGVKLYNSYE